MNHLFFFFFFVCVACRWGGKSIRKEQTYTHSRTHTRMKDEEEEKPL